MFGNNLILGKYVSRGMILLATFSECSDVLQLSYLMWYQRNNTQLTSPDSEPSAFQKMLNGNARKRID